MRIIIYTGKGGVGKTSMAAASACHIADNGKRVLIMSTDQAHSLSDVFDKKLSKEPVSVMPNLDAVEIDTVYEGEKNWGSLKKYLKQLLTLKQDGGIEVEELLVFPGLEELFSMFRILDEYEKNKYDTIIVDCAPTGETLSLLKYPEKLSNFISKVLPMKRKGIKIAGPLVEKTVKVPMPKDDVFDEVEHLMERMEKLQKLMLNPDLVSLRVVTTPEKIVVTEAKRNFTCLYLYHYNVDAIIVNRIYPKEAMEGYFNKWISLQEESLNDIKESFSEVPKFYVELQKREVRTIPVLKELGSEIFKKSDPNEVLFQNEIYQTNYEEGSLRIYLPFANKEELRLEQNQSELIVGVKNEVRRFPVPSKFESKEITGAKYEEGYLKITFA